MAALPIGSEFLVNTFTTNTQKQPSVAMDSDGDFVITWESEGQDGSLNGIYAQRYNAAGVAQGSEFLVNTSTNDIQYQPSIAMDSDGDFVITWAGVGASLDIYAQRFNAAGVAQGSEFRVNASSAAAEYQPSIAMDSDGDFIVTWTNYGQDGSGNGIYAQRFNAAGVAQGSEFRVNTFTTGNQWESSVAVDSDGDFIVTWASNGQDGSGWGIYAQRYNAAGVAQGGEFRVNTFTVGDQVQPSIAVDSDGDFVITWTSAGQDGFGNGIYAQRYNAAGVAQGSEFRVNTFRTDEQTQSSVAMDSDGDFVITWTSAGQDGSGLGVYAQQYNAAGAIQGGEFRVNTLTDRSQTQPSIAIDSDGDFIVAWAGNSGISADIYAQRFNAGASQNGEFRVNTFMEDDQDQPSVAIGRNGDFVITWTSAGQDGSNLGVYAQRYNAAGMPQGGEFRVSTVTANVQYQPSIAMDREGGFIITWASNGQDGSGLGVYAQRYNAAGVAQGSEFLVNTVTVGDQQQPSIAIDSDGDFVITWASNGQDGSGWGIYAQRFNAAGVAQGSEFQVNTFTTGNQDQPRVAIDSDGDFVITWTSAGQDGSGTGVYAQRFNAAGVA